jgi:hypothetical protein
MRSDNGARTSRHPPSPRGGRKGHRGPHAHPITNAKALKTPGEAAHAAKKKAWAKDRQAHEQATGDDAEDVPPCQDGYWIRAPTKAEREALPRFPTLGLRQVHIPRSRAELAEARAALLAADVLGFDTESKPAFIKGARDTGGPHLVQLATTTDAWLLMIHREPGALDLVREIMANESILKVGFGLVNDVRKLPPVLGAPLRNVFDFDTRFAKVGYGKNLGVRGAIAVVFNQDFRKSKKLTLANWAADQYKPPMMLYAANDAHIPAMLWEVMAGWTEGTPDTREWFKAGVQRLRERGETPAKPLGPRERVAQPSRFVRAPGEHRGGVAASLRQMMARSCTWVSVARRRDLAPVGHVRKWMEETGGLRVGAH